MPGSRPIFVVAPGGRTATGGMCRMVDYFMTEWEARGRQPPLLLVDSSGPYVKWKMPFYFAGAFLRLLVEGLRGRIGLLHIHVSERGSVLRKGLLTRLGRALRVPVILHMHGADFAEFYEGLPTPARGMVTRTFRLAARFIVLGQAWRHFFIEQVGLDPGRVVTLHNAVPGPASIPERSGDGACRIVFAGVLSERKGLKELLSALGTDPLKHMSWHLEVAGNGEQGPFREQAQTLGFEDKVRFHGWVDQDGMRRLLSGCDIMVLPSRNEGLPMIIIEAMAHGLAVVSTPVGSIRDALEDGVTGLLVPPKDVAALAQALARLIEDPATRRSMGAAGRARWTQHFEISRLNDRLQTVFAETMAGETHA